MHGKDYFKETKNYLDLLGYLTYLAFAIFYLSNLNEYDMMFVPSLICGLLRGVMTLFNLFEGTRYLIQMTITNLIDLVPFLILLFG